MFVSLSVALFLTVPGFKCSYQQYVKDHNFPDHVLVLEKEIQANKEDTSGILLSIFQQLPGDVKVAPSENDLFVAFKMDSDWYIGKIRLDIKDRDQGFLHFTCYQWKQPGKFYLHKKFGKKDGIYIDIVDGFHYRVAMGGNAVNMYLVKRSQVKPKELLCHKGEEFLSRTFDDSGLTFLLFFDRKDRFFFWVLDEEENPGLSLSTTDSVLFHDPKRHFIFKSDTTCAERKILIGVSSREVESKGFYNGPFDQLADNYINLQLSNFIVRAFPEFKLKTDEYGNLKDAVKTRVAIKPYFEFQSEKEMEEKLKSCKHKTIGELINCLSSGNKQTYYKY